MRCLSRRFRTLNKLLWNGFCAKHYGDYGMVAVCQTCRHLSEYTSPGRARCALRQILIAFISVRSAGTRCAILAVPLSKYGRGDVPSCAHPPMGQGG